jgi:hypothetical protein
MRLATFIALALMQGHGLCSAQYLKVDYCDLVANPTAYDGKRVDVIGTFRYGFEWQELYCLKCRGSEKTWVGFPNDPTKGVNRVLRSIPKGMGTVNATFRGVFHGNGGFGDGGYRFLLQVEAIEGAVVISRSGAVPEALKASERRRVCQ